MGLGLEDLAYDPSFGQTVRTQWKQLVKQGSIDCEMFGCERKCRRAGCTTKLRDPVETFRHIKTQHLPPVSHKHKEDPVEDQESEIQTIDEILPEISDLTPELSLKRSRSSSSVPGLSAAKIRKISSSSASTPVKASMTPVKASGSSPRTPGSSKKKTESERFASVMEKWKTWDPQLLESPYFMTHMDSVHKPHCTDDFTDDDSLPVGWKMKLGSRIQDKNYLSPEGLRFRSLVSATTYMELKGTYTQEDFNKMKIRQTQ